MKGYLYILKCGDNSYYTGSTNNIEKRFWEHKNFEGAIYTQKKQPVELVYLEEFEKIEDAYYREKQIQGWSRSKKEALIQQNYEKLILLSKNYTEYRDNKK
ncbi:MAG: GIY-YIG nuclease family protein [Leptospiraceae bacterium]|nr:GIY-YIG nuclease family protein [Leptospiraceae bacterium]MCP5510819.1 GIY-YIG nuclease family protein [Leptospiraceae bacterium]